MAKIAYNGCYGRFGLSQVALMRYAELKGLTIYPFVNRRPGPKRTDRCRRGHFMTERNSRWRKIGKYTVRGCKLCLNHMQRLKYRRQKYAAEC